MNDVRLETDRLILRLYRLSDFEDHFKLCADPNVMRYLLGPIKVAERLGEKLEGQAEVVDMSMLVYGIDNPRRTVSL